MPSEMPSKCGIFDIPNCIQEEPGRRSRRYPAGSSRRAAPRRRRDFSLSSEFNPLAATRNNRFLQISDEIELRYCNYDTPSKFVIYTLMKIKKKK